MSSIERVGTIRTLSRFPVKSMLGEELDSVDLSESGIVGDRAYAVRDRQTGKIAARSTRSCGPICSHAGRRSSMRRAQATTFHRCGSTLVMARL